MNDKLNWIQYLQKQKHMGASHTEEHFPVRFFLLLNLIQSILTIFRSYSFHMLEKDRIYDEVLSNKDSNAYKLIQRLVKTVTNFARKGYNHFRFNFIFRFSLPRFLSYSDPTIEPDSLYRRIQHSNEIFVHELTNEPKIAINYDIVEELRYDTWRKIQERYSKLHTRRT